MKRENKLTNARGIISILMVISLVLPYVGGFSNYNLFQLVYHFTFPVVIIILTFVDIGMCFIEFDVKLKEKIFIVTSVIILFLNRSIFSFVGWFFSQISIGGIIMTVSCVIHIIISIVHLKKK